jgi:predicted Rossmann fold nucleotide-binding protein DprA/Smf involved in DNA uptake
LLREFATLEGLSRANRTALEACNLPAPAQANYTSKPSGLPKKPKEVDAIRRIGCRILNCTEPECPQSLLQICDPPVLRQVRGDKSILPGNVTQEKSFAPNQLIKHGAKLVTNAEEVMEEPPTPRRAVLVPAEAVESEQRNLLVSDGLNPIEKKIYELLSAEQAAPINDLVETTGLNSSEVLATLLDLEMKGIIRQLPGEPFTKVLW